MGEKCCFPNFGPLCIMYRTQHIFPSRYRIIQHLSMNKMERNCKKYKLNFKLFAVAFPKTPLPLKGYLIDMDQYDCVLPDDCTCVNVNETSGCAKCERTCQEPNKTCPADTKCKYSKIVN